MHWVAGNESSCDRLNEYIFDDRMRMINDVVHHVFICSLCVNVLHALAIVVVAVVGVFISSFFAIIPKNVFDDGHISHTQSISMDTAMLAIIHFSRFECTLSYAKLHTCFAWSACVRVYPLSCDFYSPTTLLTFGITSYG